VKIYSHSMKNGDNLPFKFVFNGLGYDGGNTSPHIGWSDIPENTRSLILTCYDPQAPSGSGWWHWTVANISPEVNELAENAGESNARLPQGATHTRNDYGQANYGGAAAAAGEPHGYIFTVYALNVSHIDVDEMSSGAMAGFLLNQHKIAEASLTVYFPYA